jgi:hypothetical protein
VQFYGADDQLPLVVEAVPEHLGSLLRLVVSELATMRFSTRARSSSSLSRAVTAART